MHSWLYFLFMLSKYINCESTAELELLTIPPGGNDTQVRILRGFPCSTEEYPFMVLLLGKVDTEGWNRICGGSLLNEFWVITAAHCVSDDEADYAIIAAVNHFDKSPYIVEVKKVFIHPLFDTEDFFHDVALLMLESPLKKTEHVSYVKLPPSMRGKANEPDPPCLNGLIIGWGKTETDIPDVEDMQCAIVPMLPIGRCQGMYRGYHGLIVSREQLCTLSTEGIDACQGDSGGPLLCDSVQVGIISWGIDCGKPTNPGVYLRVDMYMKFIVDTMKYSSANTYGSSFSSYVVSFGLWLLM